MTKPQKNKTPTPLPDEEKEERLHFPIVRLDGKAFKNRLRKMKPFISTEETRYYLNGIYFAYDNQKLTLCATNGHILQEQIFDVEAELSENLDPYKVIIPRNAIDHLLKVIPSKKDSGFLTMQVLDSGKNVRFDFFDFEYITATIDATFPEYENIIPKGKVHLQSGINAGYLISALAALGDTAVDICVDNKEDAANIPHLLTSSETLGIRCVIMPMRTDAPMKAGEGEPA